MRAVPKSSRMCWIGLLKDFGDAARSAVGVEQFGAVGNGPQREKRLNAGHSFRAGRVVGDEREIAEA